MLANLPIVKLWTGRTGEMARDCTEPRDEDDPKSSLSYYMCHTGVIEVLLFVLFSSTSKAVLESVEIAKLPRQRRGRSVTRVVVAYLASERPGCHDPEPDPQAPDDTD